MNVILPLLLGTCLIFVSGFLAAKDKIVTSIFCAIFGSCYLVSAIGAVVSALS